MMILCQVRIPAPNPHSRAAAFCRRCESRG